MSVEAIGWAWKQELSSTEKLVLLALADHADPSGFCWPGQKGLAEKCKMARETINRGAKRLEVMGLIESQVRYDNAGRTIGKSYQLKLGGACDGRSHDTPSHDHRPVTDDHTESSSESSAEEPSIQNINPPRQKSDAPEAQWVDDLWLQTFLKQQQTFNGGHLPHLMDHAWWNDVAEDVNGVDQPFLSREFAKMSAWLRENPNRHPTPKGVRRFVRSWLERAAERARSHP